MNVNPTPNPVDESTFHEALVTLVKNAEKNGVTVAGGWPCVSDDDSRDYDIEIVRVDVQR